MQNTVVDIYALVAFIKNTEVAETVSDRLVIAENILGLSGNTIYELMQQVPGMTKILTNQVGRENRIGRLFNQLNKAEHRSNMQLATKVAGCSCCNKRQVGAVVVKDGVVIGTGYNHNFGKPCEDETGNTHQTVMHAEQAAIINCSDDTEGCSMYITREPCIACAKLIIQARIHKVYYGDKKESNGGSLVLSASGVIAEHIPN